FFTGHLDRWLDILTDQAWPARTGHEPGPRILDLTFALSSSVKPCDIRQSSGFIADLRSIRFVVAILDTDHRTMSERPVAERKPRPGPGQP
ncbi:uncharacterized protein BO96DRAFT_349189, partial [Aspergillus niger CBS 101883]|uniref:uncharacterized protein n=1 Tax=Aspergillus lacticoffeatus (strain CBS 101883) TaxID=1450533 RepID=UPI000D7EBE06